MKEYKLPIGCDVPETIILADGDFPSHPLALEWLRQCPYVVCCDGAANTYIRSGRMPEAIVGDGDSLLPDIKERYASLGSVVILGGLSLVNSLHAYTFASLKRKKLISTTPLNDALNALILALNASAAAFVLLFTKKFRILS